MVGRICAGFHGLRPPVPAVRLAELALTLNASAESAPRHKSHKVMDFPGESLLNPVVRSRA